MYEGCFVEPPVLVPPSEMCSGQPGSSLRVEGMPGCGHTGLGLPPAPVSARLRPQSVSRPPRDCLTPPRPPSDTGASTRVRDQPQVRTVCLVQSLGHAGLGNMSPVSLAQSVQWWRKNHELLILFITAAIILDLLQLWL